MFKSLQIFCCYLYLECSSGLSLPRTEVGDGEPALAAEHLPRPAPVDGRVGEAVHHALQQHLVPHRLLQHRPRHRDLGSIPDV